MNQIDLSRYELGKNLQKRTRVSFTLGMSSVFKKEISFSKKTFNNQKRQQFYNDLSTLLSAGVDLSSSLELLSDTFKSKRDKTIIISIRDSVIQGQSFSQTLKTSGHFTEYEYYTLKIGEETGQLVEILVELGKYYEEKIKLKRKLVSSLSYPIIVLVTAFGVIWFMISFIVPMFEDVFKRFGRDLPGLTNLIIQFSHGAKIYLLIFFLAVIVVIIFSRTFKNQTWFQKFSSALVLRLPLFGSLIRKVHLARFSLCMYLLLHSRTPLIESLTLVRDMINFYPLQRSIDTIKREILQGTPLNKSMERFKIYDKRMISMIKVAEETNQLDLIFKSLKDQYNIEIEQKTEVLGNLLEPLLIIFIGLFVGIILVSMYLPMFKLSTSFGFN